MISLLLTTLACASAQSLPGTEQIVVDVDALANVFAPDLATPPDPGGFGGGVFPPEISLGSSGEERVIIFPQILGQVAPGVNPPFFLHGPDGNNLNSTDVFSWLGISGLTHGTQSMFLSGVFLEGTRNLTSTPVRLDFTNHDTTKAFAPEIGQAFMIGDGHLGTGSSDPADLQVFQVPPTATRLILGFVDGNAFHGFPGFYDDNRGEFQVTLRILSSNAGLFLLDYEQGLFGSYSGTIHTWNNSLSSSRVYLAHGRLGTHCFPFFPTCADIRSPRLVTSPAGAAEVVVLPHRFPVNGLFQLMQHNLLLNDLNKSNVIPGAW